MPFDCSVRVYLHDCSIRVNVNLLAAFKLHPDLFRGRGLAPLNTQQCLAPIAYSKDILANYLMAQKEVRPASSQPLSILPPHPSHPGYEPGYKSSGESRNLRGGFSLRKTPAAP